MGTWGIAKTEEVEYRILVQTRTAASRSDPFNHCSRQKALEITPLALMSMAAGPGPVNLSKPQMSVPPGRPSRLGTGEATNLDKLGTKP
jgi:hypothetical protein